MAALHIQLIPTVFLTNLPARQYCVIKVVNYNLKSEIIMRQK